MDVYLYICVYIYTHTYIMFPIIYSIEVIEIKELQAEGLIRSGT